MLSVVQNDLIKSEKDKQSRVEKGIKAKIGNYSRGSSGLETSNGGYAFECKSGVKGERVRVADAVD